MNDRIDLSELKRNTDLVALLESYGVALKKRGAEYDGLCIAHTETNPSMQVYVKDGVQKWHCKACGAGGTVIDAIMVLDGCDEITAIKRLQKNGFHRETRMTTTKQIAPKLNNWMHRVAPDEMPDMTTKDYGAPVATWRYNSETGECLGYIARYATPDGGKSYRPWTFGAYSENVAAVWKPKTWTAGRRPLYGLDELAKRPDAKVCIVEGEKAADAARKLLGAMVCITWPGGANGIQSVDWSPLANRDILLIPDADKTGVGYDCMIKVAGILLAIGCKVRILDTSDQPDAWDLADALAEGWTAQQLGEWAKPRIKPYDHPKDTDIQTQVVVPQAPPPPVFDEDSSIYDLPPLQDYFDDHDEPTPQPQQPQAYYKDGTSEHAFDTAPVDLFSRFTAPPLKRGLLPEVIERHVFDLAEAINTDVAFGALTALSCVAGVLDDRIKIRVKDGFYESARIWTICCGEPSTKKSPIMDAVVAPVMAIASRVALEDAKLKQRQDVADERHKAKLKEFTQACIKSDDHEVPEPIPGPRLERRRIKCDVLTREGLERALQDVHSGVYIHNDEITAWIGSMDQYKSAGTNADRPLWLRAFGGGPMQIDKVGAGSYMIPNWSATISGGIQPSKLAALASRMDDDGLLQRFLIVTSDRPGGQADEKPHNLEYANAWKNVLEHLSETKPCGEYVELSHGAYLAMRQAGAEIYRIINSKMIGRAFTTALGKWEGVMARMILIYHAVECAVTLTHPTSREVSEETAGMAIAYMMKHLLPHMVSFYEDGLCESEAASIAKLIAGQIIADRLNEISTTRLHKNGPGKWRNASDPLKAESLNRLVEYAWIAPVDGINSATRRPTRFVVNPHVHEVYKHHAEAERARVKEAREIGAKIRAGQK